MSETNSPPSTARSISESAWTGPSEVSKVSDSREMSMTRGALSTAPLSFFGVGLEHQRAIFLTAVTFFHSVKARAAAGKGARATNLPRPGLALIWPPS